MMGPLPRCIIALFMAIGVGQSVLAAPQTFNTALPVAQGEFVFREQIILDQSGDDPSGADRDRTAWALVSVLGYGGTPELALFGVVPYVDKTLKLTDGGMRLKRSARGLGDISLFGRYTVFRRDWPGRTLRIAPFAGLELPTGEDDKSDGLGRLPPSVLTNWCVTVQLVESITYWSIDESINQFIQSIIH